MDKLQIVLSMVASFAVPQQRVLLATQLGGSPSGNEAALVEQVRDRFSKHKVAKDASKDTLRAWFDYNCVPVVKWVQHVSTDALR